MSISESIMHHEKKFGVNQLLEMRHFLKLIIYSNVLIRTNEKRSAKEISFSLAECTATLNPPFTPMSIVIEERKNKPEQRLRKYLRTFLQFSPREFDHNRANAPYFLAKAVKLPPLRIETTSW